MPRSNPAAPAITGDVYRLTLFVRSNGSVCMNVFDYMSDVFAPSPSTGMSALFTAVTAAVIPTYRLCLSQNGTLFQATFSCLSANTPPTLVAALSLVGLVAADALPDEMAAVGVRRSALRGQHGRGRVSFPAVPITFTDPTVDPNLLTPAAVVIYNTALVAFETTIVGGGITSRPVITTRPIAPLTIISRAAVVTSFLADDVLGTVRRRKPGRGI